VELKWVTESELNNDYFTVERSNDGMEFAAAGTVKGAGTVSSQSNYTFVDEKPFRGLSYYRLRQTDFNRRTTFSKIVSVKVSEVNREVIAYPNPSNGSNLNLSLRGFDLQEELQISVTNLYGQSLWSTIIRVTETGDEYISVKPSINLSPGVYVVVVNAVGGKMVTKVVVGNQ
jgi:hypothetical protein